MLYNTAYAVTLLITTCLPTQYYKNGNARKVQPKPLQPGDTVYAKLRDEGVVNLYPFDLTGTGWELVEDAIEGVHYKF